MNTGSTPFYIWFAITTLKLDFTKERERDGERDWFTLPQVISLRNLGFFPLGDQMQEEGDKGFFMPEI